MAERRLKSRLIDAALAAVEAVRSAETGDNGAEAAPGADAGVSINRAEGCANRCEW